MKKLKKFAKSCFFGFIVLLLVTTSVWQPKENRDRIRAFTRPYEFDFFSWTVNALWQKLSIVSIGPVRHMSHLQQRKVIKDYFRSLSEIREMQKTLESVYADPELSPDDNELVLLEKKLSEKKKQFKELSLLAEAVLQDQISQTLDNIGLANLRQPFPPVLYHVSELPKNLVISPRDKIRQEKTISLNAEIGLNAEIDLEDEIEENLDYSALVVPVGGISSYPSMVVNTDNLLYLLDTIAHEWTHNFLFFQPLGFNYDKTPAVRTMNETAASIAGEEISWELIHQFYYDLVKPQEVRNGKFYAVNYKPTPREIAAEFDFQQEMYQTRIKVDELLQQNKIEEAEEYMEERRIEFWENGYQIRKLNQAYFAFYGAYADKPFSAAGEDPVGIYVRKLRARSKDLPSFIHKIGQMSSFEELKETIEMY